MQFLPREEDEEGPSYPTLQEGYGSDFGNLGAMLPKREVPQEKYPTSLYMAPGEDFLSQYQQFNNLSRLGASNNPSDAQDKMRAAANLVSGYRF